MKNLLKGHKIGDDRLLILRERLPWGQQVAAQDDLGGPSAHIGQFPGRLVLFATSSIRNVHLVVVIAGV